MNSIDVLPRKTDRDTVELKPDQEESVCPAPWSTRDAKSKGIPSERVHVVVHT